MSRLRISAHNLMVETGRYKRPKKIPVPDRLCDICNLLEDEYHFVMQCKKYECFRHKMFEKLENIFTNFTGLQDDQTFIWIMKCDDADLIYVFGQYISECIQIRGPL